MRGYGSVLVLRSFVPSAFSALICFLPQTPFLTYLVWKNSHNALSKQNKAENMEVNEKLDDENEIIKYNSNM